MEINRSELSQKFIDLFLGTLKFTEEEFESMLSYFKLELIPRNFFYLKAGNVSKQKAYINKGSTRTFTIDAKGHEHILFFSFEDSAQDSTLHNKCLNSLIANKHYWTRDSLGENGFREIFATTYLRNCDFTGKKWTDISTYLGKPNYTVKADTTTIYRYRLNHYSNNYKDIGSGLLDVEVKNEIIVHFYVWFVD